MTDLTTPISTQTGRRRTSRLLKLFRDRPPLAAVLIALVDVLLSVLLTAVLRPLVPAGFQADFLTLFPLAILTALVVALLGWWKAVGFNPPTHWRNLALVIIPFLATILLPLVRGVQPVSMDLTIYYLVGYALTAFHEETVFRGLILRVLGPSSRTRAIWFSALLFGLAHGVNIFVRANPLLVLAQMVGAGTSGVGLAALRFRTQTIWVVIAIHFFEDFLLRYTRLPAIPVNVAQSVILFLVGLFILWRYRREDQSREREPLQPS